MDLQGRSAAEGVDVTVRAEVTVRFLYDDDQVLGEATERVRSSFDPTAGGVTFESKDIAKAAHAAAQNVIVDMQARSGKAS